MLGITSLGLQIFGAVLQPSIVPADPIQTLPGECPSVHRPSPTRVRPKIVVSKCPRDPLTSWTHLRSLSPTCHPHESHVHAEPAGFPNSRKRNGGKPTRNNAKRRPTRFRLLLFASPNPPPSQGARLTTLLASFRRHRHRHPHRRRAQPAGAHAAARFEVRSKPQPGSESRRFFI